MRISDWSSDVCSSDLRPSPSYAPAHRRFGRPYMSYKLLTCDASLGPRVSVLDDGYSGESYGCSRRFDVAEPRSDPASGAIGVCGDWPGRRRYRLRQDTAAEAGAQYSVHIGR